MQIFIYILISFIGGNVFADAYDIPKVVAVQDRAYSVKKDYTVSAGLLPLDAFNKSILAGVSYTYSWKPQWSWEVVNANYALNVDTSLKGELAKKFNAQPKGILDYPTGTFTSELLYSPMYGKFLFFNEKVVHTEISLGATGGVITYKNEGAVPVIGVGVLSRFFYSKDSSIKVDTRLLYQASDSQSSNFVLYFTVGYAIHMDMNKSGN